MNGPGNKKTLFRLLLNKSLDGEATAEEIQQMNALLATCPELEEYYLKLMQIQAALLEVQIADGSNFSSKASLDAQFWENMAEYEKTAPEVVIPEEKTEHELIRKVVYPVRTNRKISKLSIVFLVMNTAAIVLLFLFLRFVPPAGSIEVATLADSMNARWAGSPIQIGTRLYNDKIPLMLREGVIKIKFDNHALITIEGPAEFQILDGDMVKLNYGQLYSRIPAEAYGFQINTRHIRVTDLGTEFGVKEEIDGDTEVHVFKGRVNVISGFLNNKINIDLLAGSAREFDVKTGQLEEISCKKNVFARQIDSTANIIWRGQTKLDLVDIVGGGNGLGMGKRGSCIDTSTGKWRLESYLPARSDSVSPAANMQSDYRYHTVNTAPFIDGVFIPDNDQGPVAITTRGHLCDMFPNTSGLGWGGILCIDNTIRGHVIQLNNEQYGVLGKPALFMHGNAGITFDLAKIREAFPRTPKEFTATYGIADDYWDGKTGCEAYSDFWVLVDGQVRFCRKGVQVHQGGSISVALSEEDRFLTLVTTDGGSGSPEYDNRTSFNDWSLFGQPVLRIE